MPRPTISALTLAEYKALAEAIPEYCPKAIFTVAGQTFTASQAVTFFTSFLNAVAATSAAKTGWKDAKTAEEELVQQKGAIAEGIRENIGLMFSNNTTALAAFAIPPKKARATVSAATKAAAAVKAQATREARGTTSKKQKALITGNVTGVTLVPTIAPTTPTAPSTTATAPTVNPTAASAPVSSAPVLSAPVVSAPATSAPVSPSVVRVTAPAPSTPVTNGSAAPVATTG